MATYKKPSRDDERKFHEVRTAEKSVISCGRVRFRVGWMRPYTLERITGLALSDGRENEIPARVAALVLLNGFFAINLFYPILWRFLYHHVPSGVLSAIIAEGKKKEVSLTQDCWTCIILATAMRDSRQNLTREEAERILQERPSAKPGP